MSAAAAPAEGGHDTEKVEKGFAWLNSSASRLLDGTVGSAIRATSQAVTGTLGVIPHEKDYILKEIMGITPNPNNGLVENLVDATKWVGDQIKTGVKGTLNFPFAITTGALGKLGHTLENVPIASVTLAPLLNAIGWVGAKAGGEYVTEKNPDGTDKLVHGKKVTHLKDGLLQKAADIGFMPVRAVKQMGHAGAKVIGSIPGIAQTAALLTLIGPGSVYNFEHHQYGPHTTEAAAGATPNATPPGASAATPPAAGGGHTPPAAH